MRTVLKNSDNKCAEVSCQLTETASENTEAQTSFTLTNREVERKRKLMVHQHYIIATTEKNE